MYRILPNPNLYIDDDLNFYNNDEKIQLDSNSNGEVKIELYGTAYFKKPIWFYLLAKFNITLPRNNVTAIGNIEFNLFGKCFSKKLQYCIQTKTPILYNNDYAIPLSEPTIAISRDGKIINIHTNEEYTFTNEIKPWYTKYYKKIIINGNYHLLHRLILDAWVYNNNPSSLVIGNHIDGNKLNNMESNLEWVSFTGNMVHAVRAGLRKDNIRTTIRNKYTKEVKKFYSLRELSTFLGVSAIYKDTINNMRISDTIKDNEIKIGHLNHEWYYKNGNEEHIPNVALFCYLISNINGYVKKFYNIPSLRKEFGFLAKTPLTTITTKLNALGYHIEVLPLKKERIFEVFFKDTNTHVKNLRISEVVRITNYSRSTINNMVRTKPYYIEDIAIRLEDGSVWDTTRIDDVRLTNKRIEAVDSVTGEIHTYFSLRELSKSIGVSSKTIKKYVGENKLLYNYKLKYID